MGAGVIAAAGIKNLLTGSIDEAREAQKVGAQTEAVIKSTGGAANLSAKQFGALATSISNYAGIDDEAIQAGENLLATFTNVKDLGGGNDIFTKATKLATDMGVALGSDTSSAALMLGKALNDPAKGFSRLQRSGVSFTDSQVEQIKNFQETGQLAKAQGVILGEVAKEFGGSAKAQATFGDKAKVVFGNLKEQIGTALLPLVDTFSRQFIKAGPAIANGIASIGPKLREVRGFLAPIVASLFPALVALGKSVVAVLVPAFKDFLTIARPVGTDLVSAFTSLSSVVSGDFGSAILSVTGFLAEHKTIVSAVASALLTIVVAYKAYRAVVAAAIAIQAAFNVVMSANPIALVVIAIAGLAAGLIYAYKHSETFRNAVNKLGQVFKTVFNGIKTVVSAVVGFIKDHWRTIIVILGGPIGVAVALVTKHFDKIKAGALAVIGWIKDHWPAIKAVVTGPFETAKTVIGKVWTAIRQGASFVKDVVVGVFRAISSAIQGAIDKAQTLLEKLHAISADKGKGIKAGTSAGRTSVHREGIDTGRVFAGGFARGVNDQKAAMVNAVSKAGDEVSKKFKEKLSKVRDSLSSLKSDFASLVEPISSNFTQGLFDFDNATDFRTNLVNVRGTLTGLLGNFKTLIADGLSPGFLYRLFQEGGPGLINSLAGLPKAEAQEIGGLFGQVTSLSDELGTAVAGNTQQGAAMLSEIKKTNDKLDRLIAQGDKAPDRIAEATAQPSKHARRRAFVAA